MKNGETYNGTLANCDTWMNVHLREVICTAKDGDRFWRVPEVYLRGSMIKYLQVPDAALDKAEQEEQALRRDDRRALGGRGRGRGGGGMRGRLILDEREDEREDELLALRDPSHERGRKLRAVGQRVNCRAAQVW